MAGMLQPPVENLPALQRWSDVAYIKWKSVKEGLKKTPGPLNMIVSTFIINDETLGILARVLEEDPEANDEDGYPPRFDDTEDCSHMEWGQTSVWQTTDDRGKALLGSPVGVGAAYMLIQHKSTLGAKASISTVTAWCENLMLQIAFHVSQNS
ncbi:hypothetical protein M011DRAFT_459153 [Sporormia fimetaria CBS 119925]|uniref:Uncharacterized protein n=1 Tax=Sporormia fimetaria CBS 119925 TaxID=1340428 RepID=A0A6A6VB41_9PLEO|nr:hypothetical protein M011DRAFT_459153 [Sporormia fimetaria CBS 119925]